jgi:hypothetical protein
VVLADSFASNSAGWEDTDADDEDATTKQHLTQGKARWEVTHTKQAFILTDWPDAVPAVATFAAAVEVQRVAGPRESEAGLIFRHVDDDNYYFFTVADGRQQYALEILDQGEWNTLIDWTPSSAINVGGVNRLKVVADQGHFRFLINDHAVHDVPDDHRFPQGRVGIAIAMPKPGDTGTVEFDNFELRAPAPAAGAAPPALPSVTR